MLVKLRVEKFALIDRTEIDFGAGLNVLTGETGAGKSIIIDAMAVVLGGQGSAEYIRTGAERALVEAFFDVTGIWAVKEKLTAFGLDDDDDNLLMTRELSRTAKNICRVNGRVVTLGMYREIGRLLIDIYGQHHQQSLLENEKHIQLLDSFGGSQLIKQLAATTELFKQYREAADKIRQIKTNEQERVRRLDMFRYQLTEIEGARLLEDEDTELEKELNLLANAEKINQLCSNAYETLYESPDGKMAALDAIHEALSNLKELGKIDARMIPFAEAVEGAMFQLEDAAREIGRYREQVEYNPERLDLVSSRLEQIKQLKRKYGATIKEIISYRDQAAAGIQECEQADDLVQSLTRDLTEIQRDYDKKARELNQVRTDTAHKLEQAITAELAELAMPQVEFRIQITALESPGPKGMDDVEFMISPNPGEPLKPLAKIVSGGEMSRIMLAMKAILAGIDDMPTMIFDEVDAGLGGKALQAVAEKLGVIGRERQVICVTHAPLIASFADLHYNISKVTADQRTEIALKLLNDTERVEELSRMLGGNNITDLTKKHAREMMDFARTRRIK